ncbi:bifunctional tetrahydrofolate synthase/dihydrofolate synthase [Accumulibacter sp.]|uniref:bifunctional tetrahydrofolate synthase/dihydrofolate synthase n=1 Tax=Accumulibacter sp. TaxID=2053492 RepID=UPI0025E51A60|nr:bifunctional tetrahydrofolate synthase/dihydrofolate synthase [Accumulibacter sp.]MCM8593758.1 bifunctional tetrahydrofolate synthase/dihydrofolate synthase [Accumulibacter sp.]MCM8627706.1 bifunctional tetrahydrofolate synthase/dihydrofolate synthase [Accumulibacter sp.]MDS4047897.1 bifunctional tetrahydrofolate synthase/dihydrofolate synthase [Accumulibacter sp.]
MSAAEWPRRRADARTPSDPSVDRWLEYLEDLHPRGQAGIELGLDRVQRVRRELSGDPRCPVIVVGGTNGKGSTCAYLEAVYRFSGYRVGCYTSPHLLAYNERVRIDRQPIDDLGLCAAFAAVDEARRAAGDVPLTYFEFGTLAAVEAFAARQVEVMILEVGLGGRLDAVNAYDGDCAIVTGVALDHTDWLGSTREAIGFEKAGIFRAGKPALCADPDPPRSLVDHAGKVGADLWLLGRDFGYFGDRGQWTFWARDGRRRGGLAAPALRGAGQLRNASVALAAVEVLRPRLPLTMAAVRRAIVEVELPGRCQVLPGRPAVVLDVAHNPQAVSSLANSLAGMPYCARTLAVAGMLADKDIASSLAPLSGRVDVWLLADLAVARGAPSAELVSAIEKGALGGRIECLSDPAAAFARAAELADENDRILVFGSFHTVAAVMRSLQRGRCAARSDGHFSQQ